MDIAIFVVDGLITFALKHKTNHSSDKLTKFIFDSETFFFFFVGKRRNELFDLEHKTVNNLTQTSNDNITGNGRILDAFMFFFVVHLHPEFTSCVGIN